MRLSLAFLVDSVPFTKAVRDGETSLGGSESACLGLARALKTRGHDVHIYATKLSDDAEGNDAWGVVWHPSEHFGPMNTFVEWDVVVALRQAYFFGQKVNARLRVLWNQDLLVPQSGQIVMSTAWNVDKLVYVSEYHLKQWEDLQPELKGYGWATKNGFDHRLLPGNTVTKDPNRIIYISRPERGLQPLLEMWPMLRQRKPDATLQVARYASMYDGEGSDVAKMCETADARLQEVQDEVGGITYLGGLNKPQLYQAIAEAAVMWYPGVKTFAETSCIAAIETQACGTPFVGSYRGALPETIPSGILIHGDHDTPAYQRASIGAVLDMLDGCARNTVRYRELQAAGRAHANRYTFDQVAEDWEAQFMTWFNVRYESQKSAVLRQLLYQDDHCAAKVVAQEIVDEHVCENRWLVPPASPGQKGQRLPEAEFARDAIAHCDKVIAGKAWTAEDYSRTSITDPEDEIRMSGRFRAVNPYFVNRKNILDVACGNGAFAIGLALTYPQMHVHGLDYAEDNIARAKACAEKLGVSDRVTFEQLTVWDFDDQEMHPEWQVWAANRAHTYDGLFCGEFIEHVAACDKLVDGLEAALIPGASIIYTCPHGPFRDLAIRGTRHSEGHVHAFEHDDLRQVFGQKYQIRADYFGIGLSRRGADLGHWVVHYEQKDGHKAQPLDPMTRARRVRPFQRLTVGLIAHNAENDLGRCLSSVWPIADEIIVGDTGSSDDTAAIAAKYGAKVITLDPIDRQPEGFAGARNAVLAEATGDWFLWIDSDEMLVDAHKLRAYLEGIYNGVVLHQNHVAIDAPPSHDVPVRVFRTGLGIRFYGCVHEQPQMGGPNDDIHPILDPADVQIIHTGYLTQDQREHKRVKRNRALMLRDHKVFPTRLLSQVIYLREAVIQSDAERAKVGLTDRVAQGYLHAIQIFTSHFDDPSHKYHTIARPWYEGALKALGLGWEMELAMGGKLGGLGASRTQPERIWVRDYDEYKRIVAFKVKGMEPKMGGHPPHKTDPDVFKASPEAVSV